MALKVKGKTRPRRDRKREREQTMAYGLREPKQASEFDLFKASLADDEKPFAMKLWQMSCDHSGDFAAMVVRAENGEHVYRQCERCQLMFSWLGSKTASKAHEFTSYCPNGYDMLDWLDLYTRDRSLWRFLFMEVQAEMVEESIGGTNVSN